MVSNIELQELLCDDWKFTNVWPGSDRRVSRNFIGQRVWPAVIELWEGNDKSTNCQKSAGPSAVSSELHTRASYDSAAFNSTKPGPVFYHQHDRGLMPPSILPYHSAALTMHLPKLLVLGRKVFSFTLCVRGTVFKFGLHWSCRRSDALSLPGARARTKSDVRRSVPPLRQ